MATTVLMALAVPCAAVPPLVVGDVPPAYYRHYELYIGQKVTTKPSGNRKENTHAELVYGFLPRAEIMVEFPYVNKSGSVSTDGLGDVVLGTKWQFADEKPQSPAQALSLEVKLSNGCETDGLGSGGTDFDLRWRVEKTLAGVDTIFNAGYISVGDSGGGVRLPDVKYWAVAGRKPLGRWKLLGEVYGNTKEEYGGEGFVGYDVGFSYKDGGGRTWHAAWGSGLDHSSREALKERVYLGVKLTW